MADQPKKKQKKSKKCEANIAPSIVDSTTEEEDEHTNVEITAWHGFGLSEKLLKAIKDQGFQYPTEIQSLTLPAAIFGKYFVNILFSLELL